MRALRTRVLCVLYVLYVLMGLQRGCFAGWLPRMLPGSALGERECHGAALRR
jgi:hypothetical protein